MTTINTIITGASLVAAGAAAAATLAATGTASAGTAASSGTFTVRAHHGSATSIDLGKTGFSAGDEDLLVAP